MRVPLRWLAEWIQLDAPPEEVARRLTLAGLEVDAIARVGPELDDVIVGHVLACERHPNADRLSVCRVGLGEGEPVEIVCGAPNVAAGQKVAVLRPGGRLPGGGPLKAALIRGVQSNGMICSERELELSENHGGILVLDPDAPVGAPLRDVLPIGDQVLEIAITPNRGDCASLLGIARELRAALGGELRWPGLTPREQGEAASNAIAVAIDDPLGCHHYVARIVRGIRPGPAPRWLKDRIEAAGLRSVDVVVDVTNLVMLELGQPLHAFDLGALRGGRIRVRQAQVGEKLLTLDGETRTLAAGDLVIADAERAVALAGVMGGAETAVRETTRDVLLEAAHFTPSLVRRTARRLGLSSESSYRFERGIDPAGVERAADRAAVLLAELAGGSVAPGRVEARGRAPARPSEIRLDPSQPNRLLGLELRADDLRKLLARVEVEARDGPDGALLCKIPSYRNDLAIPVDLVEEVARVYGYEAIPTTLPVARIAPVAESPRIARAEAVRDSLCASGLFEVRLVPWIGAGDLAALRLPEGDPLRNCVKLENSSVDSTPLLATTRVPGLLHAVRRNLARSAERVALFEVASVFEPREAAALPHEPTVVAGVLARRPQAELWAGCQAAIFFELKGILERLLEDLDVGAEFESGPECAWLHPGRSATVRVGKRCAGAIGELHPDVAARFELDRDCAVFELRLDELFTSARPRALPELSDQPAIRRDSAVLVPRERTAAELLALVRASAGPMLVSVSLFDRYEGEGVPADRVSLAFRMVFQHRERTLRDDEVKRAVDRVHAALRERIGAELRGG